MNLLSYPTWLIHLTSLFEWLNIIYCFSIYFKLTKNYVLKKFLYSLIPALCSALCACIFHFFDNIYSLTLLVTLQSFMTLLGNFVLYISLLICKEQLYANKKKELA